MKTNRFADFSKVGQTIRYLAGVIGSLWFVLAGFAMLMIILISLLVMSVFKVEIDE